MVGADSAEKEDIAAAAKNIVNGARRGDAGMTRTLAQASARGSVWSSAFRRFCAEPRLHPVESTKFRRRDLRQKNARKRRDSERNLKPHWGGTHSRGEGSIVSCFHSDISTSDSKVSMFGPR